MRARGGYSEAAARDRWPLVLSLPGGVVSETGFFDPSHTPSNATGFIKMIFGNTLLEENS
ncbi:MAG: hypothetical protein CMI60_23705 [Parvibaculum sp.]|jgi:hypothetical protein|nr:hypothetical protein [Parvibaculum sp.]